ncbi:MAG: hypothetical protein PF445_10860 [Melioribacteraceae bacterium]|jgi:hypothetical protein|nr:hypothetical protein [Melioribacteraceae bacterium]
MKNLFLILSVFILSIIINGCSSSLPEIKKVASTESSIYDNDLRINTKQIYSWINRMPGSKARFHISGELELLENSKYDVANTTIKKVKIIQNNTTIYQFTPKSEIKMENEIRVILFSTIRGLLVSTIFDSDKSIDVEIQLSDSANDFSYIITEVNIEEAH